MIHARSSPFLVCMLAASIVISGCAVTRAGSLRRKSEGVEKELRAEQKRVLALAPEDPEREARLERLTELRATLSAANIGLGAVPHFVAEDKRDMAYDVLEEVYDTIDWNIPLGPMDSPRPLPPRFQSGSLNLDEPLWRAPKAAF